MPVHAVTELHISVINEYLIVFTVGVLALFVAMYFSWSVFL